VAAPVPVRPWLGPAAHHTLSPPLNKPDPAAPDAIPLAPRLTSTGGFTAQHPRGFEVGLRYRYIGDRPANEDRSVTAAGYTLLDLVGTYPIGRFKANVAVENLFDVTWNEAQFDTESQLPGEPQSFSELHFTPGTPLSFRLGLSYRF
jgi:hypothetical protein